MKKGQAGFVMAWVVFCLPVVLLFAGLVLDVGVLFMRSQALDSATDAAARAASSAWDRGYWIQNGRVRIDLDAATDRARAYLQKNMPTAHLVEVTVNPANRVNVRASTDVPFFFLRIMGWTGKTVESFSTVVRHNAT